MKAMETVTYRVRDKGGKLGGHEISFDVPVFDMDEFIKTPNADEFIKKAYLAAAKKIAREVEEDKSGSVPADLSSYEMIVARSLKYTKADIENWLNNKDWSRISGLKDPVAIRKKMELWLPTLSSRVNFRGEKPSRNVAEKVIAALADKPDPIADYLFVMLTVNRIEIPDL